MQYSRCAMRGGYLRMTIQGHPINIAIWIDSEPYRSFLCSQIRDACKDLVLSDDQLRLVMQKLNDEMNKGLSKETHDDAIVKCFTTYVQDLPNGTGK